MSQPAGVWVYFVARHLVVLAMWRNMLSVLSVYSTKRGSFGTCADEALPVTLHCMNQFTACISLASRYQNTIVPDLWFVLNVAKKIAAVPLQVTRLLHIFPPVHARIYLDACDCTVSQPKWIANGMAKISGQITSNIRLQMLKMVEKHSAASSPDYYRTVHSPFPHLFAHVQMWFVSSTEDLKCDCMRTTGTFACDEREIFAPTKPASYANEIWNFITILCRVAKWSTPLSPTLNTTIRTIPIKTFVFRLTQYTWIRYNCRLVTVPPIPSLLCHALCTASIDVLALLY